MSYLGGVLGHIAEAEFLGHFGGREGINLQVCRRLFARYWSGGVLLVGGYEAGGCNGMARSWIVIPADRLGVARLYLTRRRGSTSARRRCLPVTKAESVVIGRCSL